MKRIEVKDLSENFFEVISKEWMLVTAGDKEKFNTMTASWGGIGILFNKPVAYVFIRPERYTYEFIEKFDMFTLSFLGKEHRDIYNFCGSKSGKDVDKVKETGLKPIFTDSGNVMFEQSRLTFECKKLYATNFVPENFLYKDSLGKFYNEKNGFHKMYIVEIVNVWQK